MEPEQEEGRVFCYDADGNRRLATPKQEAEFRQWEEDRALEAVRRANEAMAAAKRQKETTKRLEARGMVPSKTKATYAYKAGKGWIEHYKQAPPGEPKEWERVPTFRYKNETFYDAIATLQRPDGERVRVLARDFTRDCGTATCGKPTCARCWIRNEARNIGPDEVTDVIQRLGNKPQVYDPGGGPPRGTVKSKIQGMGEDQQALHRLTSTQKWYKPGAARW